MPDLESLVGVGLHRLIIPSSFVAKIAAVSLKTSQEAVTIADIRLGAGAWVIQAKAIATATGGALNPDHPNAESAVTAYLYLEATTHVPYGQTVTRADDEAKLIATYRGATIMAVVGIEAATTVSVVLKARNLAAGLIDGKAEFSNIVITAIKQAELIAVAL